MPKFSGREIVSESTEKTQNRLMLFASIAILVKSYNIPLQDMTLFGIKFPASIFDVLLLLLTCWYTYSFVLKWLADLAGYRLWFRESSIWSKFNTNMKLDKRFISGGLELLKAIHKLDREEKTPAAFSQLDEKTKKLYEDFKTNVELYAARLGAAGTKFSALSIYGHFYVWVQHFILPMGFAVLSIYLLLKYGHYPIPPYL